MNRAVIALAVAVAAGATFLGLNWTAFASGDEHEFDATLTGDQEVPPVSTNMTGRFKIEFNEDESEAEFKLTVRDGVGVTQAHIHCAPAGQNGPIAAFLAGLVTAGLNVDGKWISNAALTDDNVDPAAGCGSTLAEFADAIRDGRAYANVHTVDHPAGEIRGQLEED